MNDHELTLKILFSQISSNGLVLEYHNSSNYDAFENSLTKDEHKRWKEGSMDEDEIQDIKFERCQVEWERTKVQIKINNYDDGDLVQDGYLHAFDFKEAYHIIRESISSRVSLKDLDEGYFHRADDFLNVHDSAESALNAKNSLIDK